MACSANGLNKDVQNLIRTSTDYAASYTDFNCFSHLVLCVSEPCNTVQTSQFFINQCKINGDIIKQRHLLVV